VNSHTFSGSRLTELVLSDHLITYYATTLKYPEDLKTIKLPKVTSVSQFFLSALPKSLNDLYIYSDDVKSDFYLSDKSNNKFNLHLTNSASAKTFAEEVSECFPNVKIIYDL